jgi:tRNA/tmRNA/rRNA uracil-C5-methylase (TrmA/RlmC/RlmD family)
MNDNMKSSNSILAPYYNILTYSDQLQAKEMDFSGRIDIMNRKYAELFTSHNDNTFNINNIVLDPNKYRGIVKLDKTEFYRNKTTFSFGYNSDSDKIMNNNSINLSNPINLTDNILQSYVNIGFVAGKYPTNYITNPYSVTTPTIHSIIAENVKSVIQKSNLKPFMSPPKIKLNKKARKLMKLKNINPINHCGVWKYLTIRSSNTKKSVHNTIHNTSDFQKVSTMVILTNFVRHIDTNLRAEYESVIADLSSMLLKLGVDIFIVSEYSKSLEPQSDDPIKIMFDRTNINNGTDSECSLLTNLSNAQFYVSPFSFFQINTEGMVKMYDMIFNMINQNVTESKQDVTESKQNILVDLYCGAGTIGQYLEVKGRSLHTDLNTTKYDSYFYKVIGIDCVKSSIVDARKNAELNHIHNSTYIEGKCESEIDTIKTMITNLDVGTDEKSETNIYIVIDPARDGMNKKMIKFLAELAIGINGIRIKKIIYCSCNIYSWMDDIISIQKEINKNNTIYKNQKGMTSNNNTIYKNQKGMPSNNNTIYKNQKGMPSNNNTIYKNQKGMPSNNNNNLIKIQVTDSITLDMFPHTEHYEVISQIEFITCETMSNRS